jgi:hypothetical protein
MDTISQKTCRKCGEQKDIYDFYRTKQNRDGLHSWCKKCVLAQNSEYRKAHLGVVFGKPRSEVAFEEKHKRRAWGNRSYGTTTKKLWEELKKVYNHTCLCCKRQEPEIKLTLDHVVPLSSGGLNLIKNAQPLCRSCNARKGTRYIDYRLDYRQF